MSGTQGRAGCPSLAVVGGGLAGLAAAVAAAGQGMHVELFERRRMLGGRAGSFRDPKIGRLVDDCQHVSMGCCTNLADLARRTGVADCFQRYRTAHFFGPRGTHHELTAAGWLPAPLHLAPALMRLSYLSVADRWALGRAMRRLARIPTAGPETEQTIGDWLRRQGQSQRAIEHFWSVILVGALSEPVGCISLGAARKVFLDGFLAAREAYHLEVPKMPLAEIHDRIADWLAERDVAVHRGTPVGQIDGHSHRATALVLADGSRREFDFVVVAVPWTRVRSLLGGKLSAALPGLEGVAQIQPAPITAVHLWLDRPITPLPHAVLVGRLAQWVFNHGKEKGISPINPQHPPGRPGKLAPSPFWHYCQVVISGSHELAGRSREDVLAEVRGDLEAVWPEARRARLMHWRLVTRPAAVFSCRPGLERLRPAQQTPIPNLMLAGDWTATGWPSTMESAVRSGYLAVEAVLRQLGRNDRLLAPDLKRSWLARRLTTDS